MLEFTQWLQATAVFTALRESWYVYPAILALHLAALGLFGGLIFITNLRLLGLFRQRPIAGYVDTLRPLKHAGLTLMVLCGLVMFGTKAEEYYYNAFFRAKLVLLLLIALHAAIFNRSVYARAAEFDAAGKTPPAAKVAAALSLLLWLGVLIAGRGIGYINPDLDKIHALLYLH
jgi:hypothetical protein